MHPIAILAVAVALVFVLVVGREIFDLILDVASGRKSTWADRRAATLSCSLS